MRFDISKITSSELKILAYDKDMDNNGFLEGEEINLFKQEAKTHADYAATMDELYRTNSDETSVGNAATVTSATPVATTVDSNISATKARQLQREREERIKNTIKTSTLENLVENMTKYYTDPAYAELINEVTEVVEFVQALNVNSKEDVNKISRKIYQNKDFSKFQKDIKANIEKLAKEAQIEKEADVLYEIYNDIKSKSDSETINYTEVLKQVKEEMKSRGLKNTSYYSDEAFDTLEQRVNREIADIALSKMMDMQADEVTAKTKKQVKDEVKADFDRSDKVARKAVHNSNNAARVTKNRLNRERQLADLEHVSKADLIDGIGAELFSKLEASYLSSHKNDDGTYNLTTISNEIRAAIGADEEMNAYEDYNKSEKKEALDNVRVLTNYRELNDRDLKKLKKLCNIADAPKARDGKSAFLDDAAQGAAAGAIVGAALGAVRIEQVVEVKAEGLFNTLVQQVVKVPAAASIPGGIALGFILNGLMNLIFGEEKGERTCFDYQKAEGKTFEEYAEYVQTTVDNEEKQKAIITLARLYYDNYGEDWNKHFVADLKKAAGNGVLNCLEFKMGMAEIEHDFSDNEHTYSTKDERSNSLIYADVPVIDGSKTSWAQIARQYDCLVEKYTLNGAIRILKIAQAINNGDYSVENIEKLYNLSKQGRKALENIEGFDYNVYTNMLDATCLSRLQTDASGKPVAGTGVKVPETLADCDRNPELSLKVQNVKMATNVVKSNGNAADKVVVGTQTSTKYYVRLDGRIKVYNNQQDRDNAVAAFKKTYPNAKIEKWTQEA